MDSEKDTFKTVIMFYKQVESLKSAVFIESVQIWHYQISIKLFL